MIDQKFHFHEIQMKEVAYKWSDMENLLVFNIAQEVIYYKKEDQKPNQKLIDQKPFQKDHLLLELSSNQWLGFKHQTFQELKPFWHWFEVDSRQIGGKKTKRSGNKPRTTRKCTCVPFITWWVLLPNSTLNWSSSFHVMQSSQRCPNMNRVHTSICSNIL